MSEAAKPTSTPSIPPSTAEGESRLPLLLVAGAALFNLIELRAERNFTPMLNDGSVHAQMVRMATAALRRGQNPLTSWFPDLGLGSPQFLHYQSLGAILTGAAGLVVGPNRAFSWSLYLLLSLWPISIFAAGRLFGFSRSQAAVAAAISPFLFSDFSTLAVGYEPGAYIWIGYGLWSQLFAMWTLPIAWGASWRYVRTGRYRLLAVVAGAATIGFHFMTGYLALIPVIVWVIVSPGGFALRLRRGVTYVVATALCSAWVLYPVIHFGKWTSINEFLQHTGAADSYGAPQILRWLATGEIFDDGRWAVVTVLVGIGLVACAWSCRTVAQHRALLGVFLISLVLFFGRPTLGPLIDLLPGSHDLFLRRFLMGVQLTGILIAGVGAVAFKDAVVRIARARIPWQWTQPRWTASIVAGALLVAVLAPAWTETIGYDQADATDIALQRQSEITAGTYINVLITQMEALGIGRVYAGSPAPNWGASFTVGEVPVFKYLSNLDFDIVGYQLRTASLMTDPEAYFDEDDVGDYRVFGIRYLVLPLGRPPVPKSTLILSSGQYDLWEINGSGTGYVQVASTQGTLSANRTDIGAQTESYLGSALPAEGIFKTVAYAGLPAAPDTLQPGAPPPRDVGSVIAENDNLNRGRVTVSVSIRSTAAVILKSSFDPGWQVTVDGRPQADYMVSPALVAVTVGPGTHVVAFRYHGYRNYPEFFALAFLTLCALIVPRRWVRHLMNRVKRTTAR